MTSPSKKKDSILKGIGSAALLGGLGYTAAKSNIVDEAISQSTKINGLLLSGDNTGELRTAGENIKTDVQALREATDRLKRETIERLRENFSNKIESFLNEDGVKTVDEKRAFFSALFDSIKEEELAGGAPTDIEEMIKRAYTSVSGNTPASLDSNDRQTLLRFFENNFTSNDQALERLGKSYQKYYSNISQFSATARTGAFGVLKGQQEAKNYNSLEEFFKGGAYNQTTRNSINSDMQRLNSRLSGTQAKVSYTSYAEGASGVAGDSLYARVTFSNNKVLNFPLKSGADETGNMIYRATEGLTSRYVAPSHVIKAHEMLDTTSMTTSRFSNVDDAIKHGAVVDFNTYIFNDMVDNLRQTDMLNMPQRRINEITAYQRTWGLDAPRTMMSGSLYNQDIISDSLIRNLHASRNLQASNALVVGVERFGRGDQGNVVKSLLKFYGDDLVGTSAAQTMTSRHEDPYDPNARTRLFGQIGLKASGNVTTLDAMQRLGHLDRVLLPQTAREGQMVGRYEAIYGMKGSTHFGRVNLPTMATADSGELLGISRNAKSTVGMNLSGYLIKGRASANLGLAEGVSYFGGSVFTSTSMPKTVVESGVANTRIMDLLIDRHSRGEGYLKVGDFSDAHYTVKQFFAEFGDREGRAILGHLDGDFAQITRRGGIHQFTLGLNQFSQESGRRRYHLIGEMVNENKNTKLFSWLVKDITSYADEATMGRKLSAVLGSDAEGRAVGDLYRGMGGQIDNTLLASSGQLKKSVYNLSTAMFGAMSMNYDFGVPGEPSQDFFDAELKSRFSNGGYLNRVKSLYGKAGYSTLEEATHAERAGAFLYETIDLALEQAKKKGFDQATMGHILGGVEEYHGKFGFKDEAPILNLFEHYGLDTSYDESNKQYRSAFMRAYKSNVIFAAAYATTGGVHAELGRNLARVEPRFMNYLYNNLRTSFGLSAQDATSYMSSMMVRQSGAESKSVATLGMHLSMLSLSSLPGQDFSDQLRVLGNIPRMNTADIAELKSFGQGKERQLAEFLSKRQKGQLLDLSQLITDESRLSKVKALLGGRSEIFLPGAETLENFEGFKIRGSGQSVHIEGDFNRYLTDLVSSINTLGAEKDEGLFQKGLNSFAHAKGYLATVVGSAVRQSMSGTVLGSGSYMGGGFKFGLTPEAGFEFDVDLTKRNRMREGLLDAFNKNKGYVLFPDAQAFLDGMTTYKEALKKEILSSNPNIERSTLNAQLRGETAQRVQDFFFSMYSAEKEAVTGVVQRNPTLYFTHNLPGIGLMRYDFAEGNQDAMFKYFKEYRGSFLDDEGTAIYRKRYISALREKQAAHLNIAGFDEAKYEAFTSERKRLNTQIDDIKTRLYGEPVEVNGVRVREDVSYVDSNNKFKFKSTLKRDPLTIAPEVISGEERITALHQSRVDVKEAQKVAAAKKQELIDELRKRTGTYLEADKQFNVAMQTPMVESSYDMAASKSSRIYRNALGKRINESVINHLKSGGNYQDTASVKRVLMDVEAIINSKVATLKDPNLPAAERRKTENNLKALRRNKRYLLDTIAAKAKLEVTDNSKILSELITVDEAGRVVYADLEIDSRAGYRGQDKVTKEIGARRALGYGYELDPNTLELKKSNFDLDVSGLDYRGTYDDILRQHSINPDEFNIVDQIRKERELNIVRKRGQVSYLEHRVKTLSAEEADFINEKRIFEQETYPETIKGEGVDPKSPEGIELEEDRARVVKGYDEDIAKTRNALAATKTKLEGDQGVRKSLERLVESEYSQKATMNRAVATESLFRFYEANAISDSGQFRANFMNEVAGFYGQYDATTGMTPRVFLEQNRTAARQAANVFFNTQVGKSDSRFRSLTQATKALFGIPEEEFHSFQRSVYNSATGKYETVTSKYLMNADEAADLKMSNDAYEDLRLRRDALLDDPALEAAEKDNEFVRLRNERAAAQLELEALESGNDNFLKLRDLEKSQMATPHDATDKISLTADERQLLKVGLEGNQVEFEDLTDQKLKDKYIAEGRVKNRLSKLQQHLGGKHIESFEDLFKAAEGRLSDEFEYMRYSTAEGKKVLTKTTVGKEIQTMMLGLLDYHTKHGEHGGGILQFPELNITADLTNSETGAVHKYSGRMDVSRFMIGDFDADIYQIFHDTNRKLAKKFNQKNAAFHGFFQSGGEYLFSKSILEEGMSNFAKRFGASGMLGSEFVLDQYSKEKILKDVGPIDVHVKAAMFSMVHNANETAAKTGGDFAEHFKRMRGASALIAVAQEVLVIKSKHLPVASNVAESFLNSLQSAFKTGSGESLYNFFNENIFKGGILEGSGHVEVSNIQFADIPRGPATDLISGALQAAQIEKTNLREVFDAMASTGKDLNILAMMSDTRAQKIFANAGIANVRQLNQLMAASVEGGLIGADGSWNYNALEAGLKNYQQEAVNKFKMTTRGKGVAGLALGAIGASYLVGSAVSTNSLDIENKFSDIQSRQLERQPMVLGNADHSSDGSAFGQMGADSAFYQRPINSGETYVTNSYAGKMHGEAPSYSQAQAAARQFTSAGGQAFVAVQDGRNPISSSYINKSLRD
jgi:hypothetical protein